MSILTRRLKPLLAVGTAGLLLASQASCTMGSQNTADISEGSKEGFQVGFDQVDANQDGLLTWSEVNQPFEDQLGALGWSEEDVFNRYDNNNDNYLNPNEYESFSRSLSNEISSINATDNSVAGGVHHGEGWFSFDDVDADNDGRVGFQEFGDVGLTEREEFSVFDEDGDGVFDEDEFANFDDDGDGFLNEDEFDTFTEELGIDEDDGMLGGL